MVVDGKLLNNWLKTRLKADTILLVQGNNPIQEKGNNQIK